MNEWIEIRERVGNKVSAFQAQGMNGAIQKFSVRLEGVYVQERERNRQWG